MWEGVAFPNLRAGSVFFKVGDGGWGKQPKLAKLAEFQRRGFESVSSQGLGKHLGAKPRVCAGRAGLAALPPWARVLASRPPSPEATTSAHLRSAQPGALPSSPAHLGATRCISAQPRVSRRGKQHPSPARRSSVHSGDHAASQVGGDPRDTGPLTGHVNPCSSRSLETPGPVRTPRTWPVPGLGFSPLFSALCFFRFNVFPV